MSSTYCQLCRRLIDANFGDPRLCHACIDERLDERFARWADERDAAYRPAPLAALAGVPASHRAA